MFYLRKQHVYRQETDGEGEGGGAGSGEGENETVESQTEGQGNGADTEIEAKARKMGWTPKEEFRGDPAKWRDAAEFVDRGENMLPILRKTVEKQEREIERQNREMADLKKAITGLAANQSKAEQRAYAKAYGELKAQQMEAVAAGNTEMFQRVDQAIEDLHKDVAKESKANEDNPEKGEPPPEYVEWASRNKWVDTDPNMLAYGEAQFDYIRRTRPGMNYSEQLEEVTKAVKKEFPEKFQNPRRSAAPSVESGTPVAKKSGKTFADMPKEDRETCERMVKRYGINRDEYVKQYFEGQ